MSANVNHHLGMRVADIRRGITFYQRVFGAEVLAAPFPIDGDFAEIVTDGPVGVNWKVAILRIGDGVIELFEFGHPQHPMEPTHPTKGNLLHFAVGVDDVPATLDLLEQQGGRRLWPEIVDLTDEVKVIYAADPDGNVFELINLSIDDLAKLMIEIHPEAEPARAAL